MLIHMMYVYITIAMQICEFYLNQLHFYGGIQRNLIYRNCAIIKQDHQIPNAQE